MTPSPVIEILVAAQSAEKYHRDLDQTPAKNHPKQADDEKFIIVSPFLIDQPAASSAFAG
ncbi:hypothetical protein [Rhizobium leguminosarum]|uniref:Uncharacterized protein n=1 Tax=Rhizobium leguminosarum TaxID=384 RepID=A0A7W9ZXD0_RHILE|nr:hypothetical protein [Rhizobium leguminosarum]MBB6224506.1 hypothetical protein [Rhizobium leguminosarum]